MEKQLGELDPEIFHYLEFDPPLQPLAQDRSPPWNKQIRWFPVVHLPGWDPRYSERTPPLLKAMVKLGLLAVSGKTADGKIAVADCNPPKRSGLSPEQALLRAIRGVVYQAIRDAVGTNSVNAKNCLLYNGVQGYRVKHSGRAVITPMGLPPEHLAPLGAGAESRVRRMFADDSASGNPVGINEISVPWDIYSSLQHESGRGLQQVASPKGPILAWLKRDPVLHRWGGLPVQVRKNPEQDDNTIHLPASVLEPLGADFDGDLVDVLAVPMNQVARAEQLAPSAICLHDFRRDTSNRKQMMFKPSKQYIYGLHLLQSNAALLREFKEVLDQAGAPRWPEGPFDDAKKRMEYWLDLVGTAQPEPHGRWWALLEEYALLALAADPGMGLGILESREKLTQLDVLKCGAAKREIYGLDGRVSQIDEENQSRADEQTRLQLRMADAILRGESLNLHTEGIDPIGTIMVASHALKRRFGAQIQHYVMRAHQLDARVVMAAQTLTEELTQSVLSVKTLSSRLPDFGEYTKTIASRWFGGSNPPANEDTGQHPTENPESITSVARIGGEIKTNGVAEELDRGFLRDRSPVPPAAWQKWLETPYELPKLLDDQANKELLLPLDDLRVRPFVSRIVPDE